MHIRLIVCVVIVTLLAGCVPRIQHFEPSLTEPHLARDALITSSGKNLPVKRWLPKGKARAVIVALHGFNDYSNAFAGPGAYLARRGIALYAYDQRGFGATAERGVWAGERNLIADAKDMVIAVKARYPHTPLYILGESMGGAVGIVALASKDFPEVDGAILSAPAVWGSNNMSTMYRSVLWLGAHTIPWKELSGKGLKIIASDNYDMLRALGQDPLIIKKTRIDAIYGIVQLMDSAYYKARDVKVPLMMLYGMNDQIIPTKPIVDVTDTLNTTYKLVYYPRGFHMLLRDLKAKVVLRDVAAWVNSPTGFLPSGYDLNWREALRNSE